MVITGKPFDALVYLVERAHTVVSRHELARALWPATVVEDNNLSQTVLALRRALGDMQDAPRFLVTVPRRGYQFIANVRRVGRDDPGPAESATAPRGSGPRFSRWVASLVAIAIAVTITGWVLHSSMGRAPEACSDTASFQARAFCQQALDLYRTNGGIGVSMPREIRGEIITRLNKALADDGRYAEALAWRAHVLLDSLMFDPLPVESRDREMTQRLAAIQDDVAQALRLDSSQAMALVARARLDMYRWRLRDAFAALQQAGAKQPRDSVVQHYIAMVANLMGEYALAARAARRALELDPHNPAPCTALVLALSALGDYAGAIDAANRMIRIAPNTPIGYINLARTETAVGNPRAALEAVHVAEEKLSGMTNFGVEAALLYTRVAEQAGAERLLQQFRQKTAGLYVNPGIAAMARIAGADYAAARELIEQALAERGGGMDPMPLLLLHLNLWGNPELEKADWRELRQRLIK